MVMPVLLLPVGLTNFEEPMIRQMWMQTLREGVVLQAVTVRRVVRGVSRDKEVL